MALPWHARPVSPYLFSSAPRIHSAPFLFFFQRRVNVALLHHHSVVLGPLSLPQVEEARPWLHDGAEKALFVVPPTAPVEEALAELAALPRDRVGVCVAVSPEDAKAATQEEGASALAQRIGQLCGGAFTVLLQIQPGAVDSEAAVVEVAKALRQAVKRQGTAGLPWELVVEAPSSLAWSTEGIAALHKLEAQALIPAATNSSSSNSNGQGLDHTGPLLPLSQAAVDGVDAFLACLRTDRPDGLFTTVVVDECNVALGLVYSSAESVRASVAESRGIYYSRSRGGLWRKGDSSGAVQELVGLDMDCDSDALRFIVRQRGNPAVSVCGGGGRLGTMLQGRLEGGVVAPLVHRGAGGERQPPLTVQDHEEHLEVVVLLPWLLTLAFTFMPPPPPPPPPPPKKNKNRPFAT